MNFIIGQIISAAGLIVSVFIAQFKDVKHILVGDIVANMLVALSYVFLGGLSGAWVCIVASLQCLIMYHANKRNWAQRTRTYLMITFAAAYIVGTVIVYRSWADIVSCVCALLYIMAITRKSAAGYRGYMMVNSLLWIAYDITTLAFVNMITHGSVLTSVIIAKIRLDRRKKET